MRNNIFRYRTFDSAEKASEFCRKVAAATGHSAFVTREDSTWVVKYVDLEMLESALESDNVFIDPEPYLSFTSRRQFGAKGRAVIPNLKDALEYALQAASTKRCTAKLAREYDGGFEVIYPSNADFVDFKELDSRMLEQLKRMPGLQMVSATPPPEEPPSQAHFYLLAHIQAWSLGGLMFQNNLDNARRYTSDQLQRFLGWLDEQEFPVAELELYIVGDDGEPPMYLGKAIETATAIADSRAGQEKPPQSVMCSALEIWMRSGALFGLYWGVIIADDDSAVVLFLDYEQRLIDRLRFSDIHKCRQSLRANRFTQWGLDPVLSSLWQPPNPPFAKVDHHHLKVFSRGLLWN